MTKEDKKRYLRAYEELSPLVGTIASRSGQSWWSPPGEDWHFSCDMGYIEEFLDQLEKWLKDEEIEEKTNPRRQNSRLVHCCKLTDI